MYQGQGRTNEMPKLRNCLKTLPGINKPISVASFERNGPIVFSEIGTSPRNTEKTGLMPFCVCFKTFERKLKNQRILFHVALFPL